MQITDNFTSVKAVYLLYYHQGWFKILFVNLLLHFHPDSLHTVLTVAVNCLGKADFTLPHWPTDELDHLEKKTPKQNIYKKWIKIWKEHTLFWFGLNFLLIHPS